MSALWPPGTQEGRCVGVGAMRGWVFDLNPPFLRHIYSWKANTTAALSSAISVWKRLKRIFKDLYTYVDTSLFLGTTVFFLW